MATARDAQRLVRALRAGGMTQTAIARAAGTSTRMIRFAQSGQKGANLVPVLNRLAMGERPTPAAIAATRRRTASGQPARVRQPVIRTDAGVHVQVRHSGAQTLGQQIRDASGGNIGLTIRDASGTEVRLFRKGGYDAQKAARDIYNNGGDVFATIAGWIADSHYEADLDDDSGDWTVELDTFGFE